VRQAGAASVTPSVAALLYPAKRLLDIGEGCTGGCPRPVSDLVPDGAGRCVRDGDQVAELIDSEVSLSLEETLRSSDELGREHARRRGLSHP